MFQAWKFEQTLGLKQAPSPANCIVSPWFSHCCCLVSVCCAPCSFVCEGADQEGETWSQGKTQDKHARLWETAKFKVQGWRLIPLIMHSIFWGENMAFFRKITSHGLHVPEDTSVPRHKFSSACVSVVATCGSGSQRASSNGNHYSLLQSLLAAAEYKHPPITCLMCI